jgi:serine/threonine-protein kinase
MTEKDLVGSKIDTYRIQSVLGQGGNATVYLARDERLDRVVALKMMHAFAHHPHRQRYIDRFRRGAQAAARLNHPNVLPVYDFGEWEGTFYIVMQYVKGKTLHQHLLGDAEELNAANPLPLPEVLHIAQQVGAALSHAHRFGVIHRDVKPSNILLSDDGRVFLTDFGLAHVEDAAPITQSGEILGTPHYMSPEQCKGIEIDRRSDIYSLGVVLFHLLTGQVPFEADTPFPVILKHVQEPLPSPRKLNPNVPLMVEAILRKTLAKEPAERYQAVEEFIHDLELAVREETDDRAVIPPPPPTRYARDAGPPRPTQSPDERDGVRWALVGIALGVFVGLVICGVVAFLLLGGLDLLKSPTAIPTRIAAISPTPTSTAAPPPSPTPEPTGVAPAVATPTFTVRAPTETSEGPTATPTAQPTDTPAPPSPTPPSTPTPTSTPPPAATPTPTFTATLTPTASPSPTKPSAIPAGMIRIPAGEFIQGSSDAEIDAALKMCNDAYGGNCPHTRDWFADEAPRRTVYLDGFLIDKWEVTNAQFAQFVAAAGYQTDAEKRGEGQTWRSFNTAGREDFPVIWMSWHDADAYCQWAEKRLPTEAEWEKAARGTDGRIWPWGSNWEVGRANTGDGGAGAVVAGGSYPASASPYGVMDTTGNVWEWVADWYDPLWYGKSPTNNPGGPLSGVSRVLRGGGFNNPPWEVRAPHRHSGGPGGYAPDHGFRCAQ